MKCKIYVSDEGYGPLVRQSAIVSALRELNGELDFTLQTQRHAAEAAWIVPDVRIQDRFNNIAWSKSQEGAPDLAKIELFFREYLERSEAFIGEELASFANEFVISDFVCEAFHVARKKNTPAFGVCHFTWDWFFSKMFPTPIRTPVLDHFAACAKSAEVLYFPPFTPQEILNFYQSNARSIPFIVRRPLEGIKKIENTGHFNVLIMDSGSGVLGRPMQRALTRLQGLSDFRFFLSETFRCEADNVVHMKRDELFLNYFSSMDLVVSRAGFNTMSECISARIPMLLVGEAMNPEIELNMLSIKQPGLGSFVSLDDFTNDPARTLSRFVEDEYSGIRKRMNEHELECNGAQVIAADILDRVAG